MPPWGSDPIAARPDWTAELGRPNGDMLRIDQLVSFAKSPMALQNLKVRHAHEQTNPPVPVEAAEAKLASLRSILAGMPLGRGRLLRRCGTARS